MAAPPWLLALGLVLGLLVLLPARRLQLAGLAPRTIGLLALSLWALAMLVAVSPGGAARVLIPILLVAYLAPFVAAPDRVGRTCGVAAAPVARAVSPAMKNVTPPDADGRDEAGPSGPSS